MVNDLIGGQVQAAFDVVASSLPHIRSGALRALAVTTPLGWRLCRMCRPLVTCCQATRRLLGPVSVSRAERPRNHFAA